MQSNNKGSLKVFLPLCFLSCVIVSGTRTPEPIFTINKIVEKASVDSLREKNRLTLLLIEQKIKHYGLTNKDN